MTRTRLILKGITQLLYIVHSKLNIFFSVLKVRSWERILRRILFPLKTNAKQTIHEYETDEKNKMNYTVILIFREHSWEFKILIRYNICKWILYVFKQLQFIKMLRY